MAENNRNGADTFKEAVCIDAGRVYDSCCDRDCLEDLRCYFAPEDQAVIQNALSVRLRSAEVLNVYVDVEQVSFNRGYYSCDLTFFFLVKLDVFTVPHTTPTEMKGVCYFTKKVILYGSEGNVRVFSNLTTLEGGADTQLEESSNSPRCVVQAVDPVALSAKICEVQPCLQPLRCMPDCICKTLGKAPETDLQPGSKAVYVTLGLFTIIQLIRNVQMLIPVYDFCIPEKQCVDTTDQPCDVFKRIKFPTDDFFPPRSAPGECGCQTADKDCSKS